MFNLMTTLHLLTAIFVLGPLVHGATTAARAIRTNDADAAQSSERMIRIYAIASLAVVVFGFGLMSSKPPWGDGEVLASFSETWIWLSTILWLVTLVLAFALTIPGLKQAGTLIRAGQSADSLKGKVAASGGLIAIIYVVIVVLMVYQPGS